MTHKYDKTWVHKSYTEIYKKYKGNLVLKFLQESDPIYKEGKVIKKSPSYICQVDEVILNFCSTGLIQFSPDGKLFAYFLPKKRKDDEPEFYKIYVVDNEEKDG